MNWVNPILGLYRSVIKKMVSWRFQGIQKWNIDVKLIEEKIFFKSLSLFQDGIHFLSIVFSCKGCDKYSFFLNFVNLFYKFC